MLINIQNFMESELQAQSFSIINIIKRMIPSMYMQLV